jgi:hypothetical protein
VAVNPDLEAFAHRKAVLAIVLAAAGFVILPVISSVFAVIVAHQARRMYRAHPEYRDPDLAFAAIVISWVGLVVAVALMTYIVAT